MRKKGKRKTAWLLSAAMFLSVLFGGNVYAKDDINADLSQNSVKVEAGQNDEAGVVTEGSDDTGIQESSDNSAQNGQVGEEADEAQNTQESSAPNQTENVEDSVPAEQGLINYVGVDYPYLATPADQNIVISYGDGSENVSDARIVIRKDDGGTLEMELSKKEGELFLFTYSFDETASGVYELVDFIYTQDGVEQTIHLSDIGIESVFGVNEEYPGYGATSEENSEQVTAQELEMSVVDVETGEVEAATTDIERAIEATEEQVGTAQKSRSSRAAATSRSDNLVVVLDPGHGGYDGGASANGLVEKNLTLKIAQYCKEELEQYNGVTVHMTRTDDRYLDIDERVYNARDLGADVLVSIHINSSTASGANGAEVWYPNANYNGSVHAEGQNLAQQIQNQLVALGLGNRGIHIRSANYDTYPDGSKEDWYGIIRYSKYCGFPGIIVEHAFISNPSDAAKLAQESFLKQLGIADATGIANAYGLTKIKVTGTENIVVSKDENQINVTANIVEGESDVSKLQVAVWGGENGGNDLKWYDLSREQNGTWKVSIPVSNHGESGVYYSDLYAVRKNGFATIVDSRSFEISKPVADVTIGAYDKESGSFDLIVSNIQSPSGVKEIKFPVWAESDPANTLHWYTAQKQEDGTYKATANIKNHGYAIGTYTSHIYITGKNGVENSLIAGQCEVTPADLSIELNDVSSIGRENRYQIRALNVGVYGALGIRVAVWGDENGGNDLKWNNGYQGNDGAWYADIEIADHKESGTYHADVYATMKNGASLCVKSIPFEISKPVAEVAIGAYDKESGSFDLIASNIQSPSGVKEIKFPVWSENDPSNTLYWYTAQKQEDGTYKATANIKNHGYAIGTYTSHIYITGKNGVENSLIAGQCEVTPADLSIELNDVSSIGRENRYQIRALNVGVYGALGIRVAVWGDENGGNDLKWNNGYQGNDGAWYADIEIADHKESGTYHADVYATMKNGASLCVKSIPFEISKPVAEVAIGAYDKESGSFDLIASNIQSPSGVKEIKFPVWSENDPSNTLYWYTAQKQEDGTYKATVNVRNHLYKVGQYKAHIYITGNNGVTNSLDAGNIVIDQVENNELYTIMGISRASVDQMVRYFNSTGAPYPSEALKKGGAGTVEEFCNIVYEEAQMEGVKSEVAFAQIMLETGNLQFGNDVKIEQFNFGGLGATGNGNPGHSFPDVRTGIRANIQHLKCYASFEPLVNSRVDPRWGEWLRNKAPYVQWLSIPNNPYGTGWASDKDYGTKILNIISKM